MSNVRLTSNGLVHTPNFITAWRNDYNIGGKSAKQAIHIIAETYFEGKKEAAEYVLANPDKCHVDEDNALVVNGLYDILSK